MDNTQTKTAEPEDKSHEEAHDQSAIYSMLREFLFSIGYIQQPREDDVEWTIEQDVAYRTYCKNVLSQPHATIPRTMALIPTQILEALGTLSPRVVPGAASSISGAATGSGTDSGSSAPAAPPVVQSSASGDMTFELKRAETEPSTQEGETKSAAAEEGWNASVEGATGGDAGSGAEADAEAEDDEDNTDVEAPSVVAAPAPAPVVSKK